MSSRTIVAFVGCVLTGALLGYAPLAPAYRAPEVHPSSADEEWLPAGEVAKIPEGQIEGACGLAISPLTHVLYVSDYYHRAVRRFSLAGNYSGSQSLAGGDPRLEINSYDAVCALAADGAGNLYAHEFHQAVERLLPGEQSVDDGESTGVAVDDAGNVYVDDRTYVAVYEAPVEAGEEPAEKIGLGSLVDAYGVAVDSKAGKVYVPDAADETVKVFEPSASLAVPVGTIDGPPGIGFNSLFNGALAVDASETEGEGHLLVLDNTKPLFERPAAAIYEFDSNGAYLDRLATRTVGATGGKKHDGPIFGEPSGIAIDPVSGDLYVTTGNSEGSNVLKYGRYEPLAPAPAAQGEEGEGGTSGGAQPRRATGSPESLQVPARPAGASASAVVQRHGVRVSFDGKLKPHALPRHGMAPVGIVVDAKIGATGGEEPPQLRRIAIEINRNGRFSSKGLPVCRLREIQPSTTAGALAACRRSLVGEGHFSADVKLPEQSPFPSEGKVLAFSGRLRGKPAILAHIYGTQPAPTSTVLPFVLAGSHGTYGTVLRASLPQATGSWGYVTGLRIGLRRRFSYRGKSRSFLSAGCPAPAGFPSAAFPLARTRFSFAGGLSLVSVLNRTCRARS